MKPTVHEKHDPSAAGSGGMEAPAQGVDDTTVWNYARAGMTGRSAVSRLPLALISAAAIALLSCGDANRSDERSRTRDVDDAADAIARSPEVLDAGGNDEPADTPTVNDVALDADSSDTGSDAQDVRDADEPGADAQDDADAEPRDTEVEDADDVADVADVAFDAARDTAEPPDVVDTDHWPEFPGSWVESADTTEALEDAWPLNAEGTAMQALRLHPIGGEVVVSWAQLDLEDGSYATWMLQPESEVGEAVWRGSGILTDIAGYEGTLRAIVDAQTPSRQTMLLERTGDGGWVVVSDVVSDTWGPACPLLGGIILDDREPFTWVAGAGDDSRIFGCTTTFDVLEASEDPPWQTLGSVRVIPPLSGPVVRNDGSWLVGTPFETLQVSGSGVRVIGTSAATRLVNARGHAVATRIVTELGEPIARFEVLVAEDGEERWVARSPGTVAVGSSQARIVAGSSGDVICLAWPDAERAEWQLSVSTDVGASWSVPTPLGVRSSHELELAIDQDGVIWTAWAEGTSRAWLRRYAVSASR